jgi:hypothetical protein
MRSIAEIDQYLTANVVDANETFHLEISTDENKDYRRGFYAGVLFAFLHAKANIGNIEDAAPE